MRNKVAALVSIATMCLSAAAQNHRPPATPLVTNDPFFSLWSMGDRLTDTPVRHWTEVAQPILGLIRIDGKTYRWMGTMPHGYFGMPSVAPMEQTSLEVTPLHSKYRFTAAGLELSVTFFSPLFPSDLDVLSRSVTYLSWGAKSVDGKRHQVDLMLDVDPLIAVDQPGQPVTWSRSRAHGLTLLNVGSRDQETLHQSGDRVRIDWGYFHLAIPDSATATTSMANSGIPTFVDSGNLPEEDDSSMPLPAGRAHAAHLTAKLPLGSVAETTVERHVELAYTEGYAIEYLGRRLRPYWQRNGMSEATMLSTAEKEYPQLERRGVKFDEDTMAEMEKAGGADYKYLTSLLFRQTIAAHKLVADIDGTPMFFSKENDSNGCIDTVDVTYPSSPFFLLFNPKLLEAQLEPVMRYAALPRWRFPFAPHDLGTYPLANGQVYGGGEANEEDQMPVEESGNLILMIAALEQREGNWDFAKRYMPQLTQWADYLEKKGLDPENQLSTDDFAGHLAHNTNLSIKAIEALGAFVQIARGVGDTKLADRYETFVRKLPAQWEKMAVDGDHYKLAFDQPNTWSQKYNLVWDDLLGLHLFPKRIMETEWAFYSRQLKPYGLPLDNRKTITKLDWQVWTASLASTPAQFQDLIHRLVVWADETPSRTPTTDFYDTVSGKEIGFQARSVVGGVFIKALMDQQLNRH
jgi:hypothetical protein